MPEPDRDRLKLDQALLLEAGRIMEDTSPEFALAIRDGDEISDRIERLEQTAEDLRAIAAAARALLRPRPWD